MTNPLGITEIIEDIYGSLGSDGCHTLPNKTIGRQQLQPVLIVTLRLWACYLWFSLELDRPGDETFCSSDEGVSAMINSDSDRFDQVSPYVDI